MNAATNHPNWISNDHLTVKRFQPNDDQERAVARVIRLMLNTWVLRTTFENARRHGEAVSKLAEDHARAARVQGFRDEVQALKSVSLAAGQPLFDDEFLSKTGTQIAYLLATVRTSRAAGEDERAKAVLHDALAMEEEIVTMEVDRALYGVDIQRMAA